MTMGDIGAPAPDPRGGPELVQTCQQWLDGAGTKIEQTLSYSSDD